MDNLHGFKSIEIEKRIDENKKRLLEMYLNNGFDEEAKRLKEELEKCGKENRIRIVFIGQYTSGKSTIISALTSDSSIVIDSNVSTDHTSDYSWNNVVLTDTPGLYTGNPDHDSMTIDMIKKSDLLVYCITSDLFNQYTKADFEKWAFANDYAGKMFLVINKMSKEDGEYQQLVENYSTTLNVDLYPHSIEEFANCFFDVKDYKDGVMSNNIALVELSHFEDFIDRLNGFIEKKGLLGRLDKPIQIIKASMDAVNSMSLQSDKDRAYISLVSRIENRIDRQRSDFSYESKRIIRNGMSKVRTKGSELSAYIGSDKDISEDDVRDIIENICQGINNDISNIFEDSTDKLNKELEEVLNSQPAVVFVSSIENDYTPNKRFFEKKKDKITRLQFESLSAVVTNASGKTVSLATKKGAKAAGLLLRSSEASGSKIHSIVLNVGHKFGHKFKPWEAAGITKTIGNVAKFVGPAMRLVSVGKNIKEMADASKKEKEIAKKQAEFAATFNKLIEELDEKYKHELQVAFDVYDETLVEVQESRRQVESAIASNRSMINEMASIRENLIGLQKEIFI